MIPDRSTASLHLDLVRKCVSGAIHRDQWALVPDPERVVGAECARRLDAQGLTLIRPRRPEDRWIVHQVSMVGQSGLMKLQDALQDVIEQGVPGDLIEAGAWRGGASIVMRAALEVYGVRDRCVYVADSFEGLPLPDERYPADTGDRHHTIDQLAVSVDEVRANFERFGLLDEQVRFLEGWFEDTLPTVRDRTWALIRLDGDMYSSTIQGLENLYPGLSIGGIVIIDDYHAVPGCAEAVHDYREQHAIAEPLSEVSPNRGGVFWQRERPSG